MCSHCSRSQIAVEHVVSGCRIAAWHLNESRRFFGELALPSELSAAARLDAWLIERARQQGTNRFTTRHVQQHAPRDLRNRLTVDTALAELADHGRIRVTKEGNSQIVEVNLALVSGGDA